MSWQAYVDDQLLATGKVTKAAILGKQGGVWAASAGYDLSQQEQNAITQQYFSNPDSVRGSGVIVNGFKFMTIQANEDEVIGRKGERGVFVIPTTQAILVAEYDTPISAGEANVVVTKLADYLKSVGY
ncbi:hypothetical protein L202_07216 [Cryptococcus amylolentus CBS 6039]|uniref:Profilin n=3 Tax=Cryptococcus TaxID=5206 RepID=A0A1E3HBE9_9TREE|nr:hypothetical protein L202_07216 [Cryptococcus amylolentus CBS 6039]XP_019028806.1 profilin [Cryptococcus wingfieldii CBS 7118]ODN73669.1 hypothetical protein L202_07216 [Cryptococcus amylolentus CBS 6039]ODN86814.1 profilin [Cryptococcus wingfieldii CBS 7118]ODO00436.1 hypothetical protein I350_07077 [Cryptococcus amylolentus CBS 6273]